MPQFNFQARFAPAVESGAKRQTVRATRQTRPAVGQTAHLYTGLRTAATRLLGREPITRVAEIEIDDGGVIWLERPDAPDGLVPLLSEAAEAFARADGFASADEFVGFIARTHGLPFQGVVTYW